MPESHGAPRRPASSGPCRRRRRCGPRGGGARAAGGLHRTAFAAEIAALSEPEGYFDTDNLISNEQRYLTVCPTIERAGLRGGAYIGVGPDQNFSYIAASARTVAFIVDVRRDNLLLHLLFKALFVARARASNIWRCSRTAGARRARALADAKVVAAVRATSIDGAAARTRGRSEPCGPG